MGKGHTRKARGAFYTPPTIARYIVCQALDELGLAGNDRLTLLDPACGDGIFLGEAFEELVQRRETATGERLDDVGREALVSDSLFGVDLDIDAVTEAKARLASLVDDADQAAERRARLTRELGRNIRHGDALCHLATDNLPTVSWHEDFTAVNEGGFDVVIGNPPYVNVRLLGQSRGEAFKQQLRRDYRCARGGFDLYVLFIELAQRLLRPGGVGGMIVPNKIAATEYAEPCRQLLLQETTLTQLLDLSNVDTFRGVGVYPYVLLWRKQPATVDHEVTISTCSRAEPFAVRQTHRIRQRQMAASSGFHVGTPLDVESRVPTRPLGESARLHSGTTGFAARRVADELVEYRDRVECREYFEFIVSGNIDRYSIRPGNVRYMKRRYHRPLLPHDSSVLSDTKRQLFSEPKIVFAGMTRRLEAAYDQQGLALGVQVYAAVAFDEDPFYLLGLLNSTLMSHLFRSRNQAKQLAGGYLAINKRQLSQLPIRVIASADDRARASRVAELARQLPCANSDPIEAEIDDLIYQLYRVTEAESVGIATQAYAA